MKEQIEPKNARGISKENKPTKGWFKHKLLYKIIFLSLVAVILCSGVVIPFILIKPVTPPPTVLLSVSSNTITTSKSVTLVWFSANTTSCQATSPTSWTKSTATIGHQTVSPASTTTYILTCRSSRGSISHARVTVKVPPTVMISASPASITVGNKTTLTWSSTNATSCKAFSPIAWTTSTATAGSQSISPSTNTTYVLTCQGNGGETSNNTKVTVKSVTVTPISLLPFGNISGPWRLVFDSEFNGASLDRSQWSTGVDGAPGITNGYAYVLEQECYDPAQVSVSGGVLNLTAITKSEDCSALYGTLPYTSGTVTTYGHFKYTYGYAEARIWLPGSTNISDWPAFWELGKLYDTPTGEIDILEGIEGQACSTFHNGTSSPSFCSTGTFTGGWHTFAADWEPGNINFYYDGTKILNVSSGVTSLPMYLVLDMALSSKITSPNVTPATLKVDYVRVWQH